MQAINSRGAGVDSQNGSDFNAALRPYLNLSFKMGEEGWDGLWIVLRSFRWVFWIWEMATHNEKDENDVVSCSRLIIVNRSVGT